MKENKKVKKMVLSVLIVLFVILFIVLLILLNISTKNTKVNNARYTNEDIEIIKQDVNNYLSDKITPQGISRLYGKYKGSNELNDLYRCLYSFVNYLPNLIEVNSNNTHAYYEQNKSSINKNLGITSEEEFVSLINYLKEIGYKKEKFSTCKIQSDTIEDIDNYFTFDLSFTFENFKNDFKVKVHFANNKNANPLVFYTVYR